MTSYNTVSLGPNETFHRARFPERGPDRWSCLPSRSVGTFWFWVAPLVGFGPKQGFINPWLINRGCPLFGGDSDHFWRERPPNNGTGST